MNDTFHKDVSIIKVWAYHGDGGERGVGPVIGYCSSKYDADVQSKHTGFYGGKGWVSEVPAIKINHDVYILAHDKPVDLDGKRKQADEDLKALTLASLSDEQKRVLGLK
jgi:hypothetical protein